MKISKDLKEFGSFIIQFVGFIAILFILCWGIARLTTDEHHVCEFEFEDSTYHVYYSKDTRLELYSMFSHRNDYFSIRKGLFKWSVNEVGVEKDTPNATDEAIKKSIAKIISRREHEAAKDEREAARAKELKEKVNKFKCK